MKTKVLYRIKPIDKKSIEVFYDVYKELEDGSAIGWTVAELYRWGQGFVEFENDLPNTESKWVYIDPTVGDGCELEDNISVDFEFDEGLTEKEKEEIQECWCNGDKEGLSGPAWLYDGDHDWLVEEDHVTIFAPFKVDKITYVDYNIISEESIELKPKAPIDDTSPWPFK